MFPAMDMPLACLLRVKPMRTARWTLTCARDRRPLSRTADAPLRAGQNHTCFIAMIDVATPVLDRGVRCLAVYGLVPHLEEVMH